MYNSLILLKNKYVYTPNNFSPLQSFGILCMHFEKYPYPEMLEMLESTLLEIAVLINFSQ